MSKRRQPAPARRQQRPKWVTSASGPVPSRSEFEENVRLATLSREDRLRIALDFVATDLAALTDEQRAERLRVLFTIVRPRRVDTDSGPIVWEARNGPDYASVGALQALQAQLRNGLRDFLNPATVWGIPVPAFAVLARKTPHYGTARTNYVGGETAWVWQVEAWPMIVAGVADLVWEFGDRVRTCQRCGRVFLANKRQQFCTPLHAQEARDERKAGVKRKGGK